MKKKKLEVVIIVILVCIIISICTVLFINNKNSKNALLNHLFNAINNHNVTEIPKAFHEYCSLSIEQNISEKNLKIILMKFHKNLVVTIIFHTKLSI